MLHAILFDKNIFSLSAAKKWLKNHNYFPIKDVHETRGFWRFRISPPKKGNYYAKYVSLGILFVFSE